MAELQTCFAYGRVAHNREKAWRVGHDRSIEERFVVVEQIVEIDVAFEVPHLQRRAWDVDFGKNRRACSGFKNVLVDSEGSYFRFKVSARDSEFRRCANRAGYPAF
jgi:hypothetical protein